MSSYWFVLKCPRCGAWQGKEVRKLESAVFKCKFCNKQRKIMKENEWGLSVGSIYCKNEKYVREITKELNKNSNKKN